MGRHRPWATPSRMNEVFCHRTLLSCQMSLMTITFDLLTLLQDDVQVSASPCLQLLDLVLRISSRERLVDGQSLEG